MWTNRYSGSVIPRKGAWRVLGFSSPRADRLWRDERIRHETRARYNPNAHRVSFHENEAWLAAQPRVYQIDVFWLR